jgi:Arc/MetJ-type ribon-helix-helix transcriptional regulator
MSTQTARITITLPVELLRAADRAVKTGRARKRNELLVTALRHELAAQERAAIDAAVAALACDEEFRAESEAIAEEAVQAGWEALREGAGEAVGAEMSMTLGSTQDVFCSPRAKVGSRSSQLLCVSRFAH